MALSFRIILPTSLNIDANKKSKFIEHKEKTIHLQIFILSSIPNFIDNLRCLSLTTIFYFRQN